MEAEAEALIRKIDDLGGMVRAIEEGFPQRRIAASAYRFQREVDAGTRGIVGINRHTGRPGSGEGRDAKSGGAAEIPTLRIDHEPERQQIARAQELRQRRDTRAAGAALERVRSACAGSDNVMEAVLEAARHDVTLGEISDVFRSVFGEYRDPAHL
jgi:methylmalonyl-CoA mutase N-terminal domain/subunit